MKRSLLGFAGATALLFAFTPQRAQPQTPCGVETIPAGEVCFEYAADSPFAHRYFDASGEFLGPPTWSPLDSPFSIFCVDHSDGAPSPGTTYLAYVTPVSPLDAGAFDGSLPPYHNGTNDWQLYDRAAWIVQQWFAAGSPSASVQSYQFAIWSVMDGSCEFGTSDCGGAGQTTFDLFTAAEALSGSGLQTAVSAYDWSVISDAGTDCNGARCQEFLYTTTSPVPEPGTMSLLALGLSAMARVGFRKRKRQ